MASAENENLCSDQDMANFCETNAMAKVDAWHMDSLALKADLEDPKINHRIKDNIVPQSGPLHCLRVIFMHTIKDGVIADQSDD